MPDDNAPASSMEDHGPSNATPVQIAARAAECLRIVRAPWIGENTNDLELGAKVAEQILRFIDYGERGVESGCIRVDRDEDDSCSVYVLVGHIDPPSAGSR